MCGRPGKISLQRTMPSVKKEFMAMASICHMPQSDNKLMFFVHVPYSFSHLRHLKLSSQLGHQTQRPGSHHLHQVHLETHTHTPLHWWDSSIQRSLSSPDYSRNKTKMNIGPVVPIKKRRHIKHMEVPGPYNSEIQMDQNVRSPYSRGRR